MQLSELYLNRFLYKDNSQDSTTKDSAFVAADSTPSDPAPIYSGGAAQDINTGNVTINGAQLTPGTYPQPVLDVSNWGWGQTCAFSSVDSNTVSWGSGTFKSADGTTYSISAGGTGDMSGKTYIYLDLLTSTTAYQLTTVPGDAVGIGKVLVAVANPDNVKATYNLSEATQIVGDNIMANSINASKIVTGQLVVGTNVQLGTAQDSAGVTTIIGNTVTTGFLNARAITVLGAVTAGTLTGVLIQTSALANTGIKIGNTSNVIDIWGDTSLRFHAASTAGYYGYLGASSNGVSLICSDANKKLLLGSYQDIILDAAAGFSVSPARANVDLGNYSYPWRNVYGTAFYLNGGNTSISYSNYRIQNSSDTQINGTLYATGAIECSTARIRVGTTDFYVTADPDASGKYYLRSA